MTTDRSKLQDKVLEFLTKNAGVSYSAERIAYSLGMDNADQFTPIIQVLAQLERDKKVRVTDKGEFDHWASANYWYFPW